MCVLLRDTRFQVSQEMREKILYNGTLDEIRCLFERRPPNKTTLRYARDPRVIRLILEDDRVEMDPYVFEEVEKFIYYQMEVLSGEQFFHGRIPICVLNIIREYLSFIPLWRYPLSGVMFF
jgi:hypothetical protein